MPRYFCDYCDTYLTHDSMLRWNFTDPRDALCFRLQQFREPFNVLALVKSPMGLMVGFMVIVVFLVPKLMESMDPEEMKRAQEEMRGHGVPSLANFLGGGARS